jgi:hypothetical protein
MMVSGIVIFIFLGIALGLTSNISFAFGSPPIQNRNIPACDVITLCLNIVAFHLSNGAALTGYYFNIFGALFSLMGGTVMVLLTGDVNGDGIQELPFPFNTVILAIIAVPIAVGIIQIVKP